MFALLELGKGSERTTSWAAGELGELRQRKSQFAADKMRFGCWQALELQRERASQVGGDSHSSGTKAAASFVYSTPRAERPCLLLVGEDFAAPLDFPNLPLVRTNAPTLLPARETTEYILRMCPVRWRTKKRRAISQVSLVPTGLSPPLLSAHYRNEFAMNADYL